jgi:hypothetical protein
MKDYHCTRSPVGEAIGRPNMDSIKGLTTWHRTSMAKGSVCENLSWLVDQTKVFTCRCRIAMGYANI